MKNLPVDGWVGSAVFSEDMKYRYILRRTWTSGNPYSCVFLMLNPSTATATENDPTIRRCMGYARKWGFYKLIILNIFAFRSTDPKLLYTEADPIGPKNDQYIIEECLRARRVICAWGVHGAHLKRQDDVKKMLNDSNVNAEVLALTKDGTPKHPLYLNGNLKPYAMPTMFSGILR